MQKLLWIAAFNRKPSTLREWVSETTGKVSLQYQMSISYEGRMAVFSLRKASWNIGVATGIYRLPGIAESYGLQVGTDPGSEGTDHGDDALLITLPYKIGYRCRR
jgi:hypothetical protein